MNRSHLLHLTVSAALVLAAATPARGQTWTGSTSTNWNTAANWSPATVPNSATAAVNFTNVGIGTVNIASSVQTQSLTFNNTSGNYDITSGVAVTLSGVTSINVGSGVVTTDSINLTTGGGGGLQYPSTSSLTITNNAAYGASPTLVIGPLTIIYTTGNGAITVAGTGYTQITGSLGNGSQVISGLTMSGSGQLDLDLARASSLGTLSASAGSLTVGSGTLTLTSANGDHLGVGGTTPATLTISGGAAINCTGTGGYAVIDGPVNTGVAVTGSGSLLHTSDTLYVGNYNTGMLTVQNGGTVTTPILDMANGVNSTGTTTVVGTGSLINVSSSLAVGEEGNGTLTVLNGGRVTTASATISYPSGATGAVTVYGAGSQLNVTSGLNFNNGGNGSLTVQGGGTVTCQTGFMAGTDTVTVTGAGSALTITSSLALVGMANQVTVTGGGAIVVAGITSFQSNSTSTLTVNGGTLTVGSLMSGVASSASIFLSDPASGPAATIGGDNTSQTYSGLIADANGGPGTVMKVGTGTQTLTGHLTNTGGYTVTGGTLEFSGAVVQPGSGSLTAAAGGTIQYDNGARVFGGFLYGPGTHIVTGGATFTGTTAFNSAVINVTGPASFASFTNGGTLTVAAGLTTPTVFKGFTNQGSGAITIGAVSVVNVSDFESYGMLTLNPAVVGSGQFTELVNTGTSPMYFNGGSQTFIGTAATAINPATGQPADLAGINLNGQNAVVAGGLLVNNGFVADGSPTGTATIIADFGALVKGAGYFQNSVITQNGGKFQAGNSPGSASFGNFVFGSGGVGNYVFAVDDATGTAGPSPDALGHVSGWGLVKAIQQGVGSVTSGGNFTWTATPTDKLTVALDTLVNPTTVGTDVAGPMADFDPTRAYSWSAAQWAGNYSGPTDVATLNADTAFDTSGFVNQFNGTFGWSLDSADHSLSLTYTPTPVPEPGTLALVSIAIVGFAGWRRRGQPTSQSPTEPA
jgi:T5SS/PEP-CTERM-associated repeat protein